MAFCRYCGNQVTDGTKFCPKCGQAVDGTPQQQVNQQQVNQQQAQAYQQPAQAYQQPAQAYQQPQQQRPPQPNSNMVLAILTTIFCCLPTGIYAIIQASKVDKLYMAGDYDGAEIAAGDAKKWSIIGIVLSVIGGLIYFLFFGGLTMLSVMAGAD